MDRYHTILILIVSIILVSFDSAFPQKKNVIFILADDLGWKDMSIMGSNYYETPNIDHLANQSVLFTDAYAASPLCSPTRASILTGKEPGRLRFTTPAGHVPKVVLDPQETLTAPSHFKTATPQTRTRLPNQYLTFAEVLKENGYSTAFMGKWHLGHEPYIPENQGFDVVVGGREHPGPPGPGRYFSPWDVETLPVVPEGIHVSDVLTDEAIKYIKSKKDKPFLLNLWYYDVHAPYQAKEKLKEKYSSKLSSADIQRSPTMGAMIETMDRNIGRVMHTLEELNIDEDTIIIFTSDNGGNMYDGPDNTTPTNNHPLRAGKGSNYEGGVRVPLTVKVPGLTEAGTVSDVVTSSVDHYPTLLELLDIPFPKKVVSDGISYVKALKGEDYKRAPIYSAFCHNVVATGNRANISMRHGPWKLYKFYYDGPNRKHRYELYNLEVDIGETNNLADQMPEKVKEMIARLDAHVKQAGILLPHRNENYKGNVAGPWIGSGGTDLSISNKTLQVQSIGSSPSVETVYTPNVSSGTFYLKFEMKSDSRGQSFVSWKTTGDKDYSDLKSTEFQSIHDGRWHSYEIQIPLEDHLSSIKLSPSAGKGNIALRNVRLVNEGGYYIRDWPMYD